jgi:ABC-2 type transport system ATP-binding protein
VELRVLLRELRTLGKTILISSHILPELEELCTSLAIMDGGRVVAQGSLAEIEARLRVGAVLRLHVLGDEAAVAAARDHLAGDPSVAAAEVVGDGLEVGFTGDDETAARLLAGAVGAGFRVASFARAASDLEELFLQVTGATPAEVA